MPSPFPTEIWMLIARHAIAQPWQSHQFNQPQGDFDSIEGFAQTSTVFKGIVRSLKDEIFVVTMLDFPKARIHDAAARRVRYLQISSTSEKFQALDLDRARQFSMQLSRFPMLTSISISAPGPPLRWLELMSTMPFAGCLESIDVCGSWLFPIRTDFTMINPEPAPPTISFPNLLRLRLSHDPWLDFKKVPRVFVDLVGLFIRACQKLELLSIHVTMDSDIWLEQRAAHAMSIEHLQPSEGYERDIRDCPLCFTSYDHARTIRSENRATRSLAETFPNLVEVRYASVWSTDTREECGQRGTKITREGNNIVLTRDDGMSE